MTAEEERRSVQSEETGGESFAVRNNTESNSGKSQATVVDEGFKPNEQPSQSGIGVMRMFSKGGNVLSSVRGGMLGALAIGESIVESTVSGVSTLSSGVAALSQIDAQAARLEEEPIVALASLREITAEVGNLCWFVVPFDVIRCWRDWCQRCILPLAMMSRLLLSR